LGERLTPAEILGEALRCAQDDFAMIGETVFAGGGTLNTMICRRATLRLDLALALAEYREEFSVATGNEVGGAS